MNTLESMFDTYIKMYGLDATSNGQTVKVFFKEIKDSNSQDKKYCYAYVDAIHQGDIVTVDGTDWLLTQEDESIVHGKYTRLVAQRLFQNINLAINSFLYSIKGQIITGSQGVNGTNIPISDGKIVINVPHNEMTSKIKVNDRIIKFNSAWKVYQVTNELLGMITMYLEQEVLSEGDDAVNEIPNTVASWDITFNESSYNIALDSENEINPIVTKNGVEVVSGFEIEWATSDESIITIDENGLVNGVGIGSANLTAIIKNTSIQATVQIVVDDVQIVEYKIEPYTTTIKKYLTVNYTVNQYVNGVIVPDTFTITASGVSESYYTLTTGTNSFSVKNNYGWADGLVVNCVSDSTGESVSIAIGLRPL
ncbi:MAG: Ig-like domain-containing protein [Clostridia bacterium]|nr:Ig-like domain-containing protein [Clostridia bacterium]